MKKFLKSLIPALIVGFALFPIAHAQVSNPQWKINAPSSTITPINSSLQVPCANIVGGCSGGGGGVSTSTPNTFTAPQQFSGGATNASGTHIGATYAELVSPVAGEGDFSAIQPAITADCALASPGIVYVKNGVYDLGSTGVTVSSTCSGFALLGESESSTRITYEGSGTAINVGDNSGSISKADVGNFTLVGSSSGLIGLNAERVQVSNFHDLYITGFTKTSSTYSAQGKGFVFSGDSTLNADNFTSNIHEDHNDIDLLVASTSNANYFAGLDFYGQTNPSSTLLLAQNGVGNTFDITNLSSATNGAVVNTAGNIINIGYAELLTNELVFGSSATGNFVIEQKFSNVTSTLQDNSSPAGTNDVFTMNGNTTLASTTIPSGGLTVTNGQGNFSSSGNGAVNSFRGSTGNYDTQCLGTGSTAWWCLQLSPDGTNNLKIVDSQNGGTVLQANTNGSTTIGNSGTGSGVYSATAFTAPALNTTLWVPSNFATAGCNGSSTLTDFGGCVNNLYSTANASSVAIMIPDITVPTSSWKTPINFNVNMVIPSLVCPGGARLQYGGTSTAVTFNFNVSSAHDVSQDWGCTYLGSSTVLAAGATNAATTTGILFGGTTGSNAANGIDFHDNTINGFGSCVDVATNTYMLAFHNNAVSGCGSSANQPYPGSLLTVNRASNSGERMVFSQNSFTDPANSTSVNAVYLSDNALASGFFSNNSFDDASIYVGISNGEVDVEQNHFENAAYSTYKMTFFIIASSSGATNLNVNDNVFALDNTGSTGKLSELVEHAVNLVFNDNIVENYGGASAITNCIDHTINPGQAVESAQNNWSQNSACSNWMQLTGMIYPSWNMEQQNGYPWVQSVDGGGNVEWWTGNAQNFEWTTGGNYELSGKVVAGGGTYITASTTVQATGASSTVRAGSSANASHGCFELYDAVNSSTLDYIYASGTAMQITSTKPAFCQ